ncbi:11088_t:CDS:1, partial [Gigaspora rosea]
KEFRISLAWDSTKNTLSNEKKCKLLPDQISSQVPSKGKCSVHMSKNFELPFVRWGSVSQMEREKRSMCVLLLFITTW